MRVIIAGSRDIDDYEEVERAVKDSGFTVTQIISGTATGVDIQGIIYAERNKIPIALYPADWNKFGKGAGFIRNKQMAENADALIAVWNGRSRGTQHMIGEAKAKNLKVHIHLVPNLKK